MILITSGAYLEAEFSTEVGLLPPSFLPLGNRRLFEHQIKFLKGLKAGDESLYLSIPSSFCLDDYDAVQLEYLGVKVIEVPDGLSLGDSVLYCWNSTAEHHDSLTILHGDTLFLGDGFHGKNAVSVHENRGYYKRATLGANAKTLDEVHNEWSSSSEKVVSGYFKFDNPLAFMKALIESRSDFIQAVVRYHDNYPMKLISNGVWLDFGHINSFFQSRTLMTTQRSFNELSISSRKVSKSSRSKSKKIYAEGTWFSVLPRALHIYTPALLCFESGDREFVGSRYDLEYLYLLPLSDLFVFGRLGSHAWKTIIYSVSFMLDDFSSFIPKEPDSPDLHDLDGLYLPKTVQRLHSYGESAGVDLYEKNFFVKGEDTATRISLIELAEISSSYISPATESDVSIVHGDLCFSNLLFDSRVEAIKCIDPRGIMPSGAVGLYGDRRYDLAKLYHSVVGLYDVIVAGRYVIKTLPDGHEQLEFSHRDGLREDVTESFNELILKRFGYSEKEILAITIHLFLSMLPLHSDRPDRQHAFILNAVRLYEKLKGMEI